MANLKFITNDEDIKAVLLANNFVEYRNQDSTSTENRLYLQEHIKLAQPDFCRDDKESDLIGTLLNQLIDEKNTAIFLHGGYKINGLLNFNVKNVRNEKIITVETLCAPEGNGSGSQLLSDLKRMATLLEVTQIVLFSLPESIQFYRKNGFEEYDEDSHGFLKFDITRGGNRNRNKITRRNKRKRSCKRKRSNKRK